MTDVFGFQTVQGDLAWVICSVDEVRCFVPQFGGWYETKHYVDPKVDELTCAETCLAENYVQVSGRGKKMLLQPGEYHPRVWRGVHRSAFNGYDKLNPHERYSRVYMRCIVAAESLFSEVKELFRVIEPQLENFNCFGHRIRELLILLCTEIEACWAGVLHANSMESRAKGRFTTKNYIKVCNPLRLTEWKLKLRDYEGFEFQPFRYWNLMIPTSSLPWYEAYNQVKHDREGSFNLGTLHHVLQAAAALHIMQVAQFGPGIFDILRGNRFSIFKVVEGPIFDLSEVYLSDPIDKGSFHTEVKLTESIGRA
ncbi:hypothetical protein [Pseudomonas syringae]|uniref:hypothetical protein n=1 Tax=Pseudomonas syringae TaxID=317 RepID=UPI003204851C